MTTAAVFRLLAFAVIVAAYFWILPPRSGWRKLDGKQAPPVYVLRRWWRPVAWVWMPSWEPGDDDDLWKFDTQTSKSSSVSGFCKTPEQAMRAAEYWLRKRNKERK